MSHTLNVHHGPDPVAVINVPGHGITLALGTTVPADASAGYAPGCLFQKLVSGEDTVLYVNDGSATSSDFNTVPSNITASSSELSIMDGVTATAAEINAAADVSARRVAVGDANYQMLVPNSGKPHIVANVSADRTFSFPAEADGLEYEFIPDLNAADGHDWIFDTGSDTNFFTGGVVHIDTDADAAGDEVVLVLPDGNSNSKFQVNLPAPGTWLKFICNGTTWTVCGQVVSTTAPTFADQ